MAYKSRQFPIADLERSLGGPSITRLARLSGATPRTVSRWRSTGHVPERAADRIACRAGLHVANVWPSWFDTL